MEFTKNQMLSIDDYVYRNNGGIEYILQIGPLDYSEEEYRQTVSRFRLLGKNVHEKVIKDFNDIALIFEDDVVQLIGCNITQVVLSDLFLNLKGPKEIYGLNNLNGLITESAKYMFSGCHAEIIDMTGFDLSNVNDISFMFHRCGYIKEIDLSDCNLGTIYNMKCIFANCDSLESVILGDTIDTSEVDNFSYMFSDCKKLEAVDISVLDLSSAIDLSYMFFNCKQLKEIKFGNSKVPETVTIDSMFYDCNIIKSIDLSILDNITRHIYYGVFKGCYDIENVYTNSEPVKHLVDVVKGLYNKK